MRTHDYDVASRDAKMLCHRIARIQSRTGLLLLAALIERNCMETMMHMGMRRGISVAEQNMEV